MPRNPCVRQRISRRCDCGLQSERTFEASGGTGQGWQTQPAAPTEPTLSQAEREQKAIAAITQAGGTMSTQASGIIKRDEAIKPGQPVLRLVFLDRNATDEILKQVKELKDLQELTVGASPLPTRAFAKSRDSRT